MKRICVYCGSRPGKRHEYTLAAQLLAKELALHGIGLVYGG
ncbi:MAG: TIGR00730 family Rossman fold protein, partial [Gammaproteobacteria bacterium HGW-Gammaproteobacteria-10]